ncbi:MAG: hypothetical protein [Siphoviridae sp. ctjeG17]|nr:MAG: hypothetical protein [Siphoviridae sp. ctjeG17]
MDEGVESFIYIILALILIITIYYGYNYLDDNYGGTKYCRDVGHNEATDMNYDKLMIECDEKYIYMMVRDCGIDKWGDNDTCGVILKLYKII